MSIELAQQVGAIFVGPVLQHTTSIYVHLTCMSLKQIVDFLEHRIAA